MKALPIVIGVLALAAGAMGAGPVTGHDGLVDGVKTRTGFYESYNLEKEHRYAGAIHALDSLPKSYLSELRRGWLYYLEGSYATAVTHYEAAMNLAPSSVEARLGCMLPLLAQKRYAEVESVARQTLRVDSVNYLANLRLAYALRIQHKLLDAEEVDRKMLRLYPTDISFLLEDGLAKAARSDKDGARRTLEDVLTVDPGNTVAAAEIKALGR